MSKNIFRVNTKNDLNEIISENYFKPIGITFVNNKLDNDFLNKLVLLLKQNAIKNNYMIHIVINIDDFNDPTDFYNDLKTKIMPFYIAYFTLKEITRYEDTTNFLDNISDIISGINDHYKGKLQSFFSRPSNQNNQSNDDVKSQQSLKTKIKNTETKENTVIDEPIVYSENITHSEEHTKKSDNYSHKSHHDDSKKSVVKENNVLVTSNVVSENDDNNTEELIRRQKEELNKLIEERKKLELNK